MRIIFSILFLVKHVLIYSFWLAAACRVVMLYNLRYNADCEYGQRVEFRKCL